MSSLLRGSGSHHPDSRTRQKASLAWSWGVAVAARVNRSDQACNLQIAVLDDSVNQSILNCALGFENVVAVYVLRYAFDRLAGVLGQELVEIFAHSQDLSGVDIDIGGLSGQTAD